MELKPAVTYHRWGKEGGSSLAGMLSWESSSHKVTLYSKIPIGILWLGTHNNGPASIKGTRETLKSYIKKNNHLLGIEHARDIPFILQVLSVEHPMSLRCHPNKEQNIMLHRKFPTRYPDFASKELVLVSLGYSHLLFGLRPAEQILYFLKTVPELSVVIPSNVVVDYIHMSCVNIDILLYYLFTSPLETMKLAADCYFTRMESSDECIQSSHLYNLIKTIHKLHEYDPGIFSPFFFNLIILAPGRAIYVPNAIAYCILSGDLIECCTNSVTALKLGLTTDFKDIHSFLKMADLNYYDVENFRLTGMTKDICTTMYKSPLQEAAVDRISVPKGVNYTLHLHTSCSIVLIVRGQIHTSDFREHRTGSALFLAAKEEFSFKTREDTTMYQAYHCTG